MSRNRDYFLSAYQWKQLYFVNVGAKLPRSPSIWDRQMLNVLRRANLDIFCSWYTATVKVILSLTKEIVRRERGGGRLVTLPEINSWPVRYEVGMDMANQIMRIMCSREDTEETHYSLILSVSCGHQSHTFNMQRPQLKWADTRWSHIGAFYYICARYLCSCRWWKYFLRAWIGGYQMIQIGINLWIPW